MAGAASAELAASTIPVLWDKYIVAESDRHPELLGRSVRSLAEARACEPFDVLCGVALDDDLETRFSITFANDDPTAVAELLTGEGCILGLSDAGAHVSQICDAVLPADFLAHWVRDVGVMPVEQGVRKVTGELADVLGLDRGYLAVDRSADVVVVDIERLDPGPVRRVRDMPAGGERLVADAPQGIDAVLVNGVPLRRDGTTVLREPERRPGQILRSLTGSA